MSKELKPVRCGCGGEAEVVTARGHFFVQCENCKIVTRAFRDIEKAIEAWNRAMGITHERAVEYLQNTGWMQVHDRLMMMIGGKDIDVPAKGYWMVSYNGLHCSKCNYKLDTTAIPDRCPNCNTEMKHE